MSPTPSPSSPRASPRADSWHTRAIGVTVLAFVVSAIVGFVALPLSQPDLKLKDVWDAICSAAGVASRPTAEKPIEPDFKVSSVVLTPDLLNLEDAQSIGRGATLAHQCAICHGPAGISRADSPNLTGQYASVVYKELKDFKTGARVNAVMTPFALVLSEQDMIDIAAYYAYLPRLPSPRADGTPPPRIVANGDPMRGIAPCGACHGELDNKRGSPRIDGQPGPYILSQLKAFASGERRNDISQQMRTIARQMTPSEMEAAARYYSGESR